VFGSLKKKIARATSPHISPGQLRQALDQAVGSGADTLLVHSALGGCGLFPAGVADIVAALRERTGTLCLPTHTYNYPTTAGQPGPIFNPAVTPSQNGVLTETFRRQKDVVRSINATHSLAASGSQAAILTENHELLDAPCGRGSPWDRLVQNSASVLLFGVSFRAYTPYHTAEDAADSLYTYELGTVDRLRYVGKDGGVHERRSRRQSWAPRRFAEAGDLLERVGLVKRVALGKGHLLFVRDSAKAHEFLVERLKATPNFLYEDCKVPLQ
jgi:aminoglycoside 3-N-acetyltransferase